MPLDPTRVAAIALRVLPRKTVSRSLGGAAQIHAKGNALNSVVDLYCRAYGVDLAEYDLPPEGFRTFDEFFTRRLKTGARPLDPDRAAVLSPADGRLEDCGRVSSTGMLSIKGSDYNVSELIGKGRDASQFAGGSFFVVYLSPKDYHRFHAPVSGPVTACEHIDGTLYPVNRIGLEHIAQLFARNERVAVHQDAQNGCVCTVFVGAIGVGRITLGFEPGVSTNSGRAFGLRHYARDGAPTLERGEELGMFHLGSTAIVFLDGQSDWKLVRGQGEDVRMGEAVARRTVDER